MWNKIKQFWNWLCVKTGLKKLEIDRMWPYSDFRTKKLELVYIKNETHLESKLSRKFK